MYTVESPITDQITSL